MSGKPFKNILWFKKKNWEDGQISPASWFAYSTWHTVWFHSDLITSSSWQGCLLFYKPRNRSQTLGSESSLDEGGVFDCLKPESSTSPQQLFSGLVGVSASSVTSAPFQAAGLVLGSPPEVFIQMTTLSREDGSHRAENAAFLPRPAQHHHHHHHHHFHQSGQHRSALLHSASSAERRSSRDDGGEKGDGSL